MRLLPEHAPLAIKTAGVSVVVARSFARIFYRNAFNIGLPLLECDEAVRPLFEGSRLTVDIESGEIRNGSGRPGLCQVHTEFMREMIQAGGLVEYINEDLRD